MVFLIECKGNTRSCHRYCGCRIMCVLCNCLIYIFLQFINLLFLYMKSIMRITIHSLDPICPTGCAATLIRTHRWSRTTAPATWSAPNAVWSSVIVSSMLVPSGERSAMKNRASIHLVLVVRKIHCWAVVICRRWSGRERVPLRSMRLAVSRKSFRFRFLIIVNNIILCS